MGTSYGGLALFLEHHVCRRFQRGAGQVHESGIPFGLQIPAIATVDQMILGLHERRASPFQVLRELTGCEPSESFGDISWR